MNRVSETQPSRRENDHQPLTRQTSLPHGRETNGKPGPWIEGDSKAPSASIASSTCRKAGARGKHTRNVVTTPGSVRGEEKSMEQAQGNRPEERTSLQDTANACHRYCRGRATPKLKEEQPDRKSHSSYPSIDLGVTNTPKEKEKGKAGGKLPSRLPN